MKQVIEDVRRSYEAGIYSTALLSTLSMPDACASIEYPGMRSGERYAIWYDQHVRHRLDLEHHLTGRVIYKLRCGISHELRLDDNALRFDEVLFALPKERVNRLGVTRFAAHGRSALVVDLGMYIGDVTCAVEAWMQAAEADPNKVNGLGRMMRYERTVLDPWFGDNPVIG